MAQAANIAVLARGPVAWQRWRAGEGRVIFEDLESADLRGVSLADMLLDGVNLKRANLEGVYLSGARLCETNLTDARLDGAAIDQTLLWSTHLWRASLRKADLDLAITVGAYLADADLTGANLSHALIADCELTRANVTGATFAFTTIANVDLSHVIGLDCAVHEGPTTIGIDTLLRSKGGIPDVFLRGCGYDPAIQRVLVGERTARTDAFYNLVSRDGGPIRLRSCFISFATADKTFVDRLQLALNQRDVDYWYAPQHGTWGENLVKQIDREISLRERVILVCSEQSLNDSDWVRWEIERAIEVERQRGSRVLFPIMIDNSLLAWKHPHATRIREVLAGDFRHVRTARAMEKAVSRLLEGLGMSGGT